MTHPELIFYAAICSVGILSLPFNRMAVVVIAAWLVGQFGVVLGASSLWDVIGYGLGAIFGAAVAGYSCSKAHAITASLFLPMFAIDAANGLGAIHPYYAYWFGYWLAMLQLATLPFGVDWGLVSNFRKAMRDDDLLDRALKMIGVAA